MSKVFSFLCFPSSITSFVLRFFNFLRSRRLQACSFTEGGPTTSTFLQRRFEVCKNTPETTENTRLFQGLYYRAVRILFTSARLRTAERGDSFSILYQPTQAHLVRGVLLFQRTTGQSISGYFAGPQIQTCPVLAIPNTILTIIFLDVQNVLPLEVQERGKKAELKGRIVQVFGLIILKLHFYDTQI